MILPRDYVTPAKRLGRLYNHDPRHYRFMRQWQGSQWIEPSSGSVGIRIVILVLLLVILCSLVVGGWKW